MTFFPWDAINALEEKAEAAQTRAQNGDENAARDYIDEVTELFEMDYMLGVQDASMQIGRSIDPDAREMAEAVNKVIEGKDYIQRISEYMQSGTPYDIARVVATDAHRIYNTAMFEAAKKGGATRKTWRTMGDPRVRDPHEYLDGVSIPIDAEFVTYTGDRARFPGEFGVPDLDINCRCWVTFS